MSKIKYVNKFGPNLFLTLKVGEFSPVFTHRTCNLEMLKDFLEKVQNFKMCKCFLKNMNVCNIQRLFEKYNTALLLCDISPVCFLHASMCGGRQV